MTETGPRTTRLTVETHRRIKVQAAIAGRTIEEIVEEALQDWLAVVEKEAKQA